jgi:NADH-quinone oxidoreductase subunit E
MGARTIIEHLKDRLGLEVGQTSADGLFRLEEVECLGACGMAPMMQVGKHYYENLTPEMVDSLLDQWRSDG